MASPTKTYNHSTAASALFFRNVDNYNRVHQALRVEVPGIGKEFTDNAEIGTDPDGIFYYNKTSDLSGSAKAKVLKFTVDNKNYVRIKFYPSNLTESDTYAEFVAEDPDGAVDATGMVNYTKDGRDGTWRDLNVGSANAVVRKLAATLDITLTADSISKKATLTLADTVANKNLVVDVKGTLYFKKVDDLTSTEAGYASYNNDRIVFYEDDFTGKDFAGYFIPFDGSANKLGITSANTVIISDVTWASTWGKDVEAWVGTSMGRFFFIKKRTSTGILYICLSNFMEG